MNQGATGPRVQHKRKAETHDHEVLNSNEDYDSDEGGTKKVSKEVALSNRSPEAGSSKYTAESTQSLCRRKKQVGPSIVLDDNIENEC